MRKKDKVIIWPAYFDQNNTRAEGRRVPKSLALQNPKIDEIRMAAEKLGLHPQLTFENNYPKIPWLKSGTIMVEKKGSKEQVIARIANQLLIIRREKS